MPTTCRRSGLAHDLGLLLCCVSVVLLGFVTWQTLVNRRWQILNFLVLASLGVGGMAAVNRLVGRAWTPTWRCTASCWPPSPSRSCSGVPGAQGPGHLDDG